MDRRERAGDPQAAVLAAMQGNQAGIWTALPAEVIGVSDLGGKRSISLQTTLQARVQSKDGSFSWVTLPPCVDCPVFWPSGGGVTLTFPIKAGDECLVIFASRCIDSWWQSGGVQVQAELRMHDLSDGFALVGVSSVPKVIPDISTSRAQFRSDDGEAFVEIDPSTHLIRAKTSGNLEAEVQQDLLATVEGKLEAQVTGNILVESQGDITLRAAGTINLEAGVLINLKAPAVNLTAFAGSTTSISGGTFNVTNTTWNYNNNAVTYTGGTMVYNAKNVTNTHVHGGVTIGGANTAGVT